MEYMEFNNSALAVYPMPLGEMGTNGYLAVCRTSAKAVFIDPGGSIERIKQALDATHADLEWIVLTHGHFDHIGAVGALKELTGAQIAIHNADAPMLTDAELNLSGPFGAGMVTPPADRLLHDNDQIVFGDSALTVIHSPGHTPGGILLDAGEVVFTGDTIFNGSIGRTDFPGGSYDTLMHSILEKVMCYGDDMALLSGHGDPTTVGAEKLRNPYITTLE